MSFIMKLNGWQIAVSPGAKSTKGCFEHVAFVVTAFQNTKILCEIFLMLKFEWRLQNQKNVCASFSASALVYVGSRIR